MALRSPGKATNLYYVGRVIPAALPTLADDAIWAHPLLAELADPHLRADLTELARKLPAIIEHLAQLPQLLSHGDASPQNLLVPADGSETFVIIDWTMSGLTAAGDDLSQLLIGLAHDGALAVDQLPALRELVARQYTAGLASEGFLIDEGDVRDGMDGGLAVRSALTAIPFERLGDPVTHELTELFRHRLALTRYLVDLGLALPVG